MGNHPIFVKTQIDAVTNAGGPESNVSARLGRHISSTPRHGAGADRPHDDPPQRVSHGNGLASATGQFLFPVDRGGNTAVGSLFGITPSVKRRSTRPCGSHRHKLGIAPCTVPDRW